MHKLKNHEVAEYVPREPFSFELHKEFGRRTRKDYCDILKRPGYDNEDIYAEQVRDLSAQNLLWGRTFFLEDTNHLGLSVAYHVNNICPGFVGALEYQTGPLPMHLRMKLAKLPRRRFTLRPVQISVSENTRELEFHETRRDYYNAHGVDKNDRVSWHVRPTARPVAYENCSPDRHEAYFYSHEGIEIIQTTSLYGEVIVLNLRLINVSEESKDVSVRISDKRGMGFEELLGIIPPRVEHQVSDGLLVSKYVEWPLTGMIFVVHQEPEAEWRIINEDDTKTFLSEQKHLLSPRQEQVINVMCACGYDADELKRQLKLFLNKPEKVFLAARKDWNDYFNKVVPAFTCSDANYEKLYYWSFFAQRFNFEDFYWDGKSIPHVCPRRGIYQGAFWWDSAFHAIITKWLNDPHIAMNNIQSISPDESSMYGCTALAIWDCFLRSPRPQVLAESLDMLHRIEESFVRNDRNGNMLPSLNEGVWDYPYRWAGHYAQRGFSDQRSQPLSEPIEMTDLAAMVARHYEITSAMHRIRGDEAQAAKYKEKSGKAKQAINESMWNPKTGFYHDRTEKKGTWLPCKSIAGFMPMIARIPNRLQALSLIRHLKDEKEFRTPLRVPTISRSSEGYNPKGYWYGCVWPQMNWLVIEGLANYDRALASEIIHEWAGAATRNAYPSMHETYSAFGEGQNLSLQGWSGLFADLIIRRVMGIVLRPDELLEFDPWALRTEWEYASFENFVHRGHAISVFWKRTGKKGTYSICIDGTEVAKSNGPVRIILEKKNGKWRQTNSPRRFA